MKRLPLRRSTIALIIVFAVTMALYLLIRPDPAPSAPVVITPVAPHSTGAPAGAVRALSAADRVED